MNYGNFKKTLITSALISLSLPILSSCSTCEPKTEYVDRVVEVKPTVSIPPTIQYPPVNLQVWGDYSVYKAQCESKIDKCNAEFKTIGEVLK